MEGNDDLPCEFDVVVVGTGMVESIIAASCSRIGKSVLHLDSNLYYGDYWATVGLEALQDFSKRYGFDNGASTQEVNCISDCSDIEIHPTAFRNVISNLAYKWFLPATRQKSEEEGGGEIEVKENITHASSESTEESSVTPNNTDDTSNQNCTNEVTDTIKDQSDNTKEDVKKDEQIKEKQKVIDWNLEQLKEQSRKFNIDLAPKVIYSTGAMVDLLLKSCVYRYTEFQSVSQILAQVKSGTDSSAKLERVPCTKSDVFSNRSVSVVDKRVLMKVLNYCLNFNETLLEYEELKDQLFLDYLKRERVPEHLIQYIFYSIAMATGRTSFLDATKRIQCFLKNVGRYGNSPFLWPVYGSGELLQAFCRLSAVYGGVYYLGRGTEAIAVSKVSNNCVGVVSNSKLIRASNVITSVYHSPLRYISESKPTIHMSRTILFTDRALHLSEKEEISILHYPAKDDAAISPIILLELPPMTGSSPKGLYVVHISCQRSNEDWSEVRDLIDELFNKKHCETNINQHEDELSQQLINNLQDIQLKDWLNKSTVEGDKSVSEKPNILYAFHYTIKDTCNYTFSSDKPDNLHFCHGPNSNIDFDRAIIQAKEVFTHMFPTDEFLEPTPDPNEITLSDLIPENDSTNETNIDVMDTNENKTESNDNDCRESTLQSVDSEKSVECTNQLEETTAQISSLEINEN